MKSFKDFCQTVSEQKHVPYTRDSFIQGKMFKVGDLVESPTGQAEIISIGTNYVTLIREGKISKCWANEVKLVEEKRDIRPQETFNGSLNFRGYITKKFDRNLTNSFIEAFHEGADLYAYYKCVVLTDSLLKASPNNLIEGYDKYCEEHQKASRYLDSFGIKSKKIELIGEALEIIKREIL